MYFFKCFVLFVCFVIFINPACATKHKNRIKNEEKHEEILSFSKPKENIEDHMERAHLRSVTGPGCPYAAAWLTHVSLFCSTKWYMESTKMETATFNIFDGSKGRKAYQFSDPENYYVNHMSMYEHWYHKKFSFGQAARQTFLMANRSYHGECMGQFDKNYINELGYLEPIVPSKSTEFLALLPFYGGLPPNVTDDKLVKSLGQGNSLVNAHTKGLQAMAAICSLIRYFGHVIVGVARDDDHALMQAMVSDLPKGFQRHIHIIQLELKKPAHLPFHLLAYGQAFVKKHNCKIMANSNLLVKSKYMDAFDICDVGEDKDVPHTMMVHNEHGNVTKVTDAAVHSERKDNTIRYVYYTEADQILRLKSIDFLYGLASVTDEKTFVLPHRREKQVPSDPLMYMSNLTGGRFCGGGDCSYEYNAHGRTDEVFDNKSNTDFQTISCMDATAKTEDKNIIKTLLTSNA